MLKKIILFSILCSLLFSCGKKEDPKYKAGRDNLIVNKV
jgi:hypothetical protein